jgi:hypothetical protein
MQDGLSLLSSDSAELAMHADADEVLAAASCHRKAAVWMQQCSAVVDSARLCCVALLDKVLPHVWVQHLGGAATVLQ